MSTYSLLDKVWVLDEEAFSEELIKALSEGKATIYDGVAYWAKGSGKTGIIQHIPFKETAVKSVEEAINTVQMTTVMTSALSTTFILGAIIIQTQYLARKLDKIQETVDEISREQYTQNIVFYLDKVTEYIGGIEFARTLLGNRAAAGEIKEFAYVLLPSLVSKRNHILSFVDNILNLVKDTNIGEKNYDLIVKFSHLLLEILPQGIHTEFLLSCRSGKPLLGEEILIDGQRRYDGALGVYKSFLNDQYKALVKGNLPKDRKSTFESIEAKAKALFTSKENKLLLSLPADRIEIQKV